MKKKYLKSGIINDKEVKGSFDLEAYILSVLAKETCCNKFLVLEKFTTVERDALTGVVAGTAIYNTTTSTIQSYNGTVWA